MSTSRITSFRPTRRSLILGAAALATPAMLSPDTAFAQEAEPALDPRFVGETVSFPAKRWTMKGWLVRTRSGGRRPGVLVLPDQRGSTPSFRNIARRLAAEGFVAFVPDLGAPFGLEGGGDDARIAIAKLTTAEVVQLFDASLDTLARQQDCNGSVGGIGYIWGGSFVLQLAMATPSKLKCGVAYYTLPPSPDKAQTIKVPMQFHYAEQDARTGPVIDAFEKQLIGHSKVYEQYIYDGVGASFANETMTRAFNREATELAWERTIAFFRKTLATA